MGRTPKTERRSKSAPSSQNPNTKTAVEDQRDGRSPEEAQMERVDLSQRISMTSLDDLSMSTMSSRSNYSSSATPTAVQLADNFQNDEDLKLDISSRSAASNAAPATDCDMEALRKLLESVQG